MKKSIFTVLVAFTVVSGVFGTEPTFVRIIHKVLYVGDIQSTRDGGYLLAGEDARNGNGEAFITRLDEGGNVLWSRLLGGPALDAFSKAAEAIDGSIFAVGQTESFVFPSQFPSIDGLIAKFTPAGDLIWVKNLGESGDDQIASASATTDGGVVLFGETNSYHPANAEDDTGRDVFVTRLDPSGKIMWFRAFGSRGDDLPLNMTASKDGGYLLTLLTTGGSTITKINSRGIILWARAFSELFIISGPVEDMAGHVYIAGTYYNPYDPKSIPDLAIVKMTPGGQVIWKKQLGNPGKAEVANALTIHAERIVLAATNEEYMPVLAELDTGGKLMWVRTFGLTNVQNVSLTSTKDQGIAFISQAFNNEDFETAMFRLDSRGRLQSCALDHSASFQIKKAHFSSSLLTLISNRQIKPRVASRPMKLRKVNLNVTRPCP